MCKLGVFPIFCRERSFKSRQNPRVDFFKGKKRLRRIQNDVFSIYCSWVLCSIDCLGTVHNLWLGEAMGILIFSLNNISSPPPPPDDVRNFFCPSPPPQEILRTKVKYHDTTPPPPSPFLSTTSTITNNLPCLLWPQVSESSGPWLKGVFTHQHKCICQTSWCYVTNK